MPSPAPQSRGQQHPLLAVALPGSLQVCAVPQAAGLPARPTDTGCPGLQGSTDLEEARSS